LSRSERSCSPIPMDWFVMYFSYSFGRLVVFGSKPAEKSRRIGTFLI
jgi:hypothetical protein